MAYPIFAAYQLGLAPASVTLGAGQTVIENG